MRCCRVQSRESRSGAARSATSTTSVTDCCLSPLTGSARSIGSCQPAFHWDKNSVPPALPEDIVSQTRDKYIDAYRLLVDDEFPWA